MRPSHVCAYVHAYHVSLRGAAFASRILLEESRAAIPRDDDACGATVQ